MNLKFAFKQKPCYNESTKRNRNDVVHLNTTRKTREWPLPGFYVLAVFTGICPATCKYSSRLYLLRQIQQRNRKYRPFKHLLPTGKSHGFSIMQDKYKTVNLLLFMLMAIIIIVLSSKHIHSPINWQKILKFLLREFVFCTDKW